MALTSYAGGLVFGRRFGTGDPTIVALHGWGRRGDDFAPVLQGTDAIALDLPGFGASPAPQSVMGARGYAESIAPIFADFDRPPVVLGHSFGGRVAVALAASRPDLVGSLVLTGVPLLRREGGRGPSWSFRLIRTANRMRIVSDERMERIRRSRGSADYRAATGIMRDILVRVVNESYEAELRALQTRVRLVWGADDTDASVDVARRAMVILEEAGVDAELTVVPGAGHFLPMEHPEVFRRVLADEAGS